DTDRDANAAFLKRHPLTVWPSFYVLDAADEQVLGYWQGAASLGELRGFLEQALAVRDAEESRSLDPNSPLALLVEARRAESEGAARAAARAYEKAIAAAPADWRARSAALFGWLYALFSIRDAERCATVGLTHAAQVDGAALPADFSYYLFECSYGLRDAR